MPRRLLNDGAHDELHPISELPHPIIAKATESFGANEADDNFVGSIGSSTKLRLLEIKQSQWRGGVWIDEETGVCWLIVAGLAKGGHKDHDDFYQRILRENNSTNLEHWLPTTDDLRLLKSETAARLMTEWELSTQRKIRDVFQDIHSGGLQRISIDHPIPTRGLFATIDIQISSTEDTDEVTVVIEPSHTAAGSNLLWKLTTRVLISINPPEQIWDRYRNTYYSLDEAGTWLDRLTELNALVKANELAQSIPGSVSHYSHRKHPAGSTITGKAVRSLCGAFFVPTQDHTKLPQCPECKESYTKLPQ